MASGIWWVPGAADYSIRSPVVVACVVDLLVADLLAKGLGSAQKV